jgi:hypothetical protein
VSPLPPTRAAFFEYILASGSAPLAVFVLHSLAGRFFGHEPYVDPISHFFGGVAIAFFFRRICAAADKQLGQVSPLGLDLLAFGLAVTAALVWELAELASDIFLGTHIQRSARNVLRDLTLGAGGAWIYVFTIRLRALARRAGKVL